MDFEQNQISVKVVQMFSSTLKTELFFQILWSSDADRARSRSLLRGMEKADRSTDFFGLLLQRGQAIAVVYRLNVVLLCLLSVRSLRPM